MHEHRAYFALLRPATAVICATAVIVGGCSGSAPSSAGPSASSSLASAFPSSSASFRVSTSPSAPAGSSAASWPPGWDTAFCPMLDQAEIAQELLVDVERALGEGSTKDARNLAHELSDTAAQATQLLDALPDWPAAQAATVEIATLMDYGSRAGDAYTSYFAHGATADLRQARNLRRQDGDAVPSANAKLALLSDAGLRCPNNQLTLEGP